MSRDDIMSNGKLILNKQPGLYPVGEKVNTNEEQ